MIRLLVVDDSALMRRLLTGIFEGEGDFTVATARDGAAAIEQLHRFGPDVITLDINMPGMDGIACLDRIMVEKPCPVVMVSSYTAAGANETMRALELGAIDFIPKPEGAVTLDIDSLAPRIVEKVRGAAAARLRPTLRLADRVRARSGLLPARKERRVTQAMPAALVVQARAAPGDGLVLVGTSTGGPQALDALLGPLPADFPWPILVAQHMPSTFTGALAERLDRLCALAVSEVSSPTPLNRGVYIARGDADMIVRRQHGALVASAAPSDSTFRWHPSVDRMVSSAMKLVAPEKLIGVLMTGMGNDGAGTMAELKRAGGRTIAESEETAVVWGMPGELVKAGGAGAIAPLDQIAGRLVEMMA